MKGKKSSKKKWIEVSYSCIFHEEDVSRTLLRKDPLWFNSCKQTPPRENGMRANPYHDNYLKSVLSLCACCEGIFVCVCMRT